MGRLDDIGADGLGVVKDICDIFKAQNSSTQVLCASLKQPYQVEQVAKAGAGYATIPYGALNMCFEHPLSARALTCLWMIGQSFRRRLQINNGTHGISF